MMTRKQNGFTLLELVMVIMLISIASIPILGQFSQASSMLLSDEVIQTAAQLAQERAENIMADRRNNSYAAIATGTVNDVLVAPYNSYSRTVEINSPPTGSGCAAGATCKEVIVQVDHSGQTRAEVTFLLVNY